MKINNSLNSVGLPSTTPASSRPAAEQSSSANGAGNVAAKVPSTTFSAEMQGIQNALANAPTVNTERVKEIKQAIAEGRFTIDPEKIADGLLENVQQMLDYQSRGKRNPS